MGDDVNRWGEKLSDKAWKRIDGDEAVALRFKAAKVALDDAHQALIEPNDNYADRCILAAGRIARAELLLNNAVALLEELTGIPFEAIAEDPNFGKGGTAISYIVGAGAVGSHG